MYVEKVLRGEAEQRCIRLVLRHLDGKDRGSIHPAKRLALQPSEAILPHRGENSTRSGSGIDRRLFEEFERKHHIKGITFKLTVK